MANSIALAVLRLMTSSNFVGCSTVGQRAFRLLESCLPSLRRVDTFQAAVPIRHQTTLTTHSFPTNILGSRIFNAKAMISFRYSRVRASCSTSSTSGRC